MNGQIEMKDSGIPWLGNIPQHWDVRKIKNCASLVTDRSNLPRKIALENIEGMTGGYIETESTYEGNGIDVRVGDIVYGKLRPYLCKAWKATFACNAVGDFYVFRCNCSDVLNDYIHYIFLSDGFNSVCNASTYGAKMPRVSATFIRNLQIPVPPLSEQRAIAGALDRRCSLIDELVAVERCMTAALQEYKTALITEAVTKGLNPNAPTKETLLLPIRTTIPNHWEMVPLRYVCTCNDDTLPESTDANTLIRYVEIGNVDSSEGVTGSSVYTFQNAPSRARRITKRGDVIISTVRTYLRAIAVIKEDGLIVSTGFAVLRSKCRLVDNGFLMYAVRSEPFIEGIIANSVGINYPSINTSQLLSLSIPLPSLAEQRAISAYLDARCKSIDALISLKREKIALLEEYKKSVIYEYVTGKKQITQ